MTGDGVLLGDNVSGVARQPIMLSMAGRRLHTYVVGQTGTGKSTLLLNLVCQDIEAGRGVCVSDPHGELVDQTLERIPAWRMRDVVVLDPSDRDRPVGFNFLEHVALDDREQLVESFIGVPYQLWDPHRTESLALASSMRRGMRC